MNRRLNWINAAAFVVLIAALMVRAVPVWAASEDGAERRVALIVGNGAYVSAPPLVNPSHDAQLIADTLKQLGFELIGDGPLIDADRPALERAIREFGQRLQGGAVGLFYYSGHGIQVNGANYLVPVAANLAKDNDVKYELLDVGFVLDEMTNAGNRLNIVILDACRNNPFGKRGLRSLASGLGQMVAPAGTVIGYATQPDNVAADGAGWNSPYTAALAKALQEPGLDLFATFNEVGVQVKQATAGAQQPWLSASPIEGRFYFAGQGAPAATAAPAPAPTPVDADAALWESIKASEDSGDFKAYLDRFPQGQFATQARQKVAENCAALAAPFDAGAQPAGAAADPDKAIAACKADPDDPRSNYLLGRALEAAGRPADAVPAYRRAGEAGSVPAASELATLYDSGRGVRRDAVEAVRWYRIAADQGAATAQVALASFYGQGRGVGKDDEQAARWYRKAAEQGSPAAQAALAAMFESGRGVPRDQVEALRWFRKAAEQGNAAAETKLGEAYGDGNGVSHDEAEAVRWYRKAADQGDPAAEYDLGWSYQFGLGVPTDRAEAARWYHKAADAGNPRARDALAGLTGSGQ